MKFKNLAFLGLVAATFAGTNAQAATRMLFGCTGDNGDSSIQLSVENYQDGQLNGVSIERRGIYDHYYDQRVRVAPPVEKQAVYRPRNPRYQGLEKYVVDTRTDRSWVLPQFNPENGRPVDSFDFSQYEFMLPPRAQLEPIWRSPSERGPNGTFKGYLSMRYSNGDAHTTMELNCTLGWRND